MSRKESGFSLVELLVAIVVLGIVAAAITSLFGTIQRIQIAAGYREAATRAAQRQVETLRNNNYNLLVSGESIDFTSSLPDTLPKDRNGDVTVSEPLPGLRRVDVTVTYSHGDSDQTVKLTSLIGEIGITQ